MRLLALTVLILQAFSAQAEAFDLKTDLSELRRVCQAETAVVSVGPLRDPLFAEELFAFAVQIPGQGLLDCAYFGLEPQARDARALGKLDAQAAAKGVAVAEEAIRELRATSVEFSAHFHATAQDLQTAQLRSLGGDEKSLRKIRELWQGGKQQEAIWLAGDQAAYTLAGRMQRKLIQTLETDQIVEQKPFNAQNARATKALIQLKQGITILFKPVVNLGDSLGGVLNEVAVSRIDRQLGFFLVAASVRRNDSKGQDGSFQYFVKDATTAEKLGVKSSTEDMDFLDRLIGNSDRHLGNLMRLNDTGRWFAIDHNRSIDVGEGYVNRYNQQPRIPSRRVLERLRAFTEPEMTKALGDVISANAIRILTARREALLRYSDALIKSRGDEAFLR